MTLRVPIEQFAQTVRRMLSTEDVFVTPMRGGTIVTAFSPRSGVRVLAHSREDSAKVCELLQSDKLKPHAGQWVAPEEAEAEEVHPIPFIVAVAYSTGTTQPGVWVDAFPTLPTQAQALRALFDEFRDTGELEDVAFEEFVRQANPTVVIVSPTELRSFAEAKEV